MARIRSIHPGLASDESFMAMSMAAKAAWPLLWTECDDKGVFEWKPIVLKARIFPADNINFAEILSEWEALNCVKQFNVGGKTYGAVRNFRKFQRPKTPNDTHPAPDEIRNYVGLTSSISETLPKPSTTEGEKPSQMEDVGGKRKEEEGNKHTPPSVVDGAASTGSGVSWDLLEAKLRKAAGWETEPNPNLAVVGPIVALIEAGASLELDVLPTVAADASKANGKTWKFFVPGIRRAWESRVSAGRPLSGKSEAENSARKAAAAKFIADHNAQVERASHGSG